MNLKNKKDIKSILWSVRTQQFIPSTLPTRLGILFFKSIFVKIFNYKRLYLKPLLVF